MDANEALEYIESVYEKLKYPEDWAFLDFSYIKTEIDRAIDVIHSHAEQTRSETWDDEDVFEEEHEISLIEGEEEDDIEERVVDEY